MPRIGLDFALDSLGGGLGGVNCDFTTFYNGVSLVNDPFVNGSPVTGPIRIDTENNEDDAIVSDGISYKFDVDDFFSQKFSFDQPTSGVERTYIFTSAGNADVALIIPTNLIPYLEVDNGTTTIQLTSSTAVVQGQVYNIKFVTAGIESNKSFTLFMDGIEVSGAQFIDMSGVTLNKLTLGTKEDFTDRLSMSLYEVDSNQIGYTDFVSRLPPQNDPNGNKFFSTTGVTYTLFPQTPLTEYYPYFGLGFGWDDAYYVSDTYCGDCNLTTYFDGSGNFNIGFVGIPAVPKTAAMHFVDSVAFTASLPSTEFGLAVDWNLNLTGVTIASGLSAGDTILKVNDVNGIAYIRIFVQSSTQIRMWIRATDLTLYQTSVTISDYTDRKIDIIGSKSGTSLTLTADGVTGSSVTYDTAKGADFVQMFLAASTATNFQEIDMTIESVELDILDKWETINRVDEQGGDTVGKIISNVEKYELAINDDSPNGVKFPFAGAEPTVYIEEDVLCDGNNLVTNNGIAVRDNGEFVFNTP